MSFRRKLNRVKKNILSNIRFWLRNSITIEKIAALFVIICVVFILVCNYILQTPVKLKSLEINEINIRSGTLRLPQNDPRVIQIAKHVLKRRPYSRKAENLRALPEEYMHPEINKITDYILKLSKNQVMRPALNGANLHILRSISKLWALTDGFFVEYPAKDGVFNSQTILLEKLFNWTGLLIEHNPKFIDLLVHQNRYCWISTACLSVKRYPEAEKFESAKTRHITHNISNKTNGSVASSFDTNDDPPPTYFAQCFPLYSILLGVDTSYIDFLSLRLDDAATALAILKTLPFNDSWSPLFIKIISVDVPANSKEYRKIFQFVTSQGYIMFRYIKGSSEADKSRQVYIHQTEFKV